MHCHNDLGLAVANSLQEFLRELDKLNVQLMELVKELEMHALEEIVMAMKTRNDLMPYETGINTNFIKQSIKRLFLMLLFQYNLIKRLLEKMLLHMKLEYIKMECLKIEILMKL